MARFVVCVSEPSPMDPNYNKPWMAIVEAEDEFDAAYQYPGYRLVFSKQWFRDRHEGVVANIAKNWEDFVCVTALDELTTSFLST